MPVGRVPPVKRHISLDGPRARQASSLNEGPTLPPPCSHQVWVETHWRKFYPEEVKTACKHQQQPKQGSVYKWGFGAPLDWISGRESLTVSYAASKWQKWERSLGEKQTISNFHILKRKKYKLICIVISHICFIFPLPSCCFFPLSLHRLFITWWFIFSDALIKKNFSVA